MGFPDGSRLVRLDPGTGTVKLKDLTPRFFAAADPVISFNGAKIFFSGRKSSHARWQVWSMNADGSKLRQLTHCPGGCLSPVCLPRGRIAFTEIAEKGSGQWSAVYVSKDDGTNAHPITFGPGNFRTETVLLNGRLVVSADEPLVPHGPAGVGRALYWMNPDGSELTLLRQFRQGGIVRTEADELENGAVLFVERGDAGGRESGGRLAWIRRGRLHSSLLTDPQAVYWSAHELSKNLLVVSKASANGRPDSIHSNLYAFDLKRRTLGSLLYANARFSSVQAVPLKARPAPRYYWSILHPGMSTGRILCLDAYLSSGAPEGRLRRRISKVRVIELQSSGHEKRLGDAPVQMDGSFYIRVPADRPIRFALLSAQDHLIQAQRSWIWVRPGEDRGCLGCHESPALTPRDHWPLALRRFNGPTPVGLRIQPKPAH